MPPQKFTGTGLTQATVNNDTGIYDSVTGALLAWFLHGTGQLVVPGGVVGGSTNPWYDVTSPSFAGGALANGVHDDTAAIQAAIDACNTAGGGVVYMPFIGTGVYRVVAATSIACGTETSTCALRMRTGVHLVAAQGVTIQKAAWVSGDLAFIGAPDGTNNWSVDNLIFDGQYTSTTEVADYGIHCGDANNVRVTRCEFFHLGTKGVMITPTNGANRVMIDHNNIHDNSGNGLGLNKLSYGLITDNFIHDCQTTDGAESIICSNLSFVEISRNLIVNWDSIRLCTAGTSHDVWVVNNYLSALSTAAQPVRGLDLENTMYNIHVRGNTFDVSPSAGTNAQAILVGAVTSIKDVEIEGNIFIGLSTHNAAINVANTCSNFLIKGNRCIGFAVFITASNKLTDSMVIGNHSDGAISVNVRCTVSDNYLNLPNDMPSIGAIYVSSQSRVIGNYVVAATALAAPGIRLDGNQCIAIGNFVTLTLVNNANVACVQIGTGGAASGHVVEGNVLSMPAATNKRYIYELNAGSGPNYYLNNNIVEVSTDAIHIINATPTSVIRGNSNWNPRGKSVTQPAVPASGTAQTNNTTCDCDVFVNGGAVSQVSIGGNATGQTQGAFRVPVGQTITLTYTTAPTWNWFGD